MRPEAEFELSQEETASLLAQSFPKLAPIRLRPFGEGWDNVAWLVNDEFVFRLPRRQMGADCLHGELTVLPHLVGRLPIPIPELLFIGEPSDAFPWPFAGYRVLPGTPADELRMDEEARQSLAAPLAQFLKTLHLIPVAEIQSWQTPGDLLGRMNVPERIARSRRWLADAQSQGLIDDAARWELLLHDAEAAATARRVPCLVHGDLYSKHFLVDSGTLSGIIDWGDVHLGEPSGDLAVGMSFFEGSARDTFLDAYGPVSEQTLRLARLRALNHSAACLLGAGKDEAFREESRKSLERLLC